MSREAGTVPSAVPSTMRETGKVARDGDGARRDPTIPPMVTVIEEPATKTSCAPRSRSTLRWSKALTRLDGPGRLPADEPLGGA